MAEKHGGMMRGSASRPSPRITRLSWGELEIEGSGCKRAWAYAEKELTHPTRMVTTTVRVRGGVWPLVPVHTAEPIPKSAIFRLLQELRQVEVQAPVRCGQVILADGAGTGVGVLASRDLPAMD